MDDVRATVDALPLEFDSRQAAAVGLTHDIIDRLVRANRVIRVQPGIFRRATKHAAATPWRETEAQYLSRLRVALLTHPRHASSHVSAALLYGWPVRIHPDTHVHLTAVDVQPRSRRSPGVFLHHSDSMPNQVEIVAGLRTLARARTVADCLRSMRPPLSVAIADAALREASVTRDEIQQVIDWQHGWVGRPKARRSLQLVDPRRESWLESFSFITLYELGIALPTAQVEVFDSDYGFVGRVDGLWLDRGTAAEADGVSKYLKAVNETGLDATEVTGRRMIAERHRERTLTDLGLQVVRWTTDEVTKEPQRVARRVRAN